MLTKCYIEFSLYCNELSKKISINRFQLCKLLWINKIVNIQLGFSRSNGKKEKKNEEKPTENKTGATELFIALYNFICTRDLSSPHYQSTFKAFTLFFKLFLSQ